MKIIISLALPLRWPLHSQGALRSREARQANSTQMGGAFKAINGELKKGTADRARIRNPLSRISGAADEEKAACQDERWGQLRLSLQNTGAWRSEKHTQSSTWQPSCPVM